MQAPFLHHPAGDALEHRAVTLVVGSHRIPSFPAAKIEPRPPKARGAAYLQQPSG